MHLQTLLGKQIVLASANAGKCQEIQHLLSPLEITIKPQSFYGINSVEETGTTFVENAILKARHSAKQTNLPALADDSGLLVHALRGAPGIYSARYSGQGATDARNNAALLKALETIPEQARQAYYYCCLVLMQGPNDPSPLICEGRWHGRILFSPVGDNGFGYDPIFFVPTHGCSAAELDLKEKNKISHRHKALVQLLDILQHQQVSF